jgi:RimJ/RimL family protein N-acetyltransferase
MVGQHRARVTLRRAQEEDSARLMEWRNEPDAVRFSSSGRRVTPEEHARWFVERRDSATTRLWIAEEDGSAVGQVRIDVNNDTGTVSIAVAADQRGRGLGTAMLRAMLVEIATDSALLRLRALAHPDNTVSLRAFERAGFHRRPERVEGFTVLERSLDR